MNKIKKTKPEQNLETIKGVQFVFSDGSIIKHGSTVINRDGQMFSIKEEKGSLMMYRTYSNGNVSKSRYGTFSDSHSDYILMDKHNINEIETEVMDIVNGKTDLNNYINELEKVNDQTTSLVGTKSKEFFQMMQSDYQDKLNRFECIKRVLANKMEAYRNQLSTIVENFKSKLKKVMKVLLTIQLYLGIEEDIFQITEGEPAPIDEPLSFRQALLYMDEEVAVLDNDGIDFKDIDKFDEFISKHFEKIIPEKKSVVVFRVRRNDKDYGDKYLNAIYNAENKTTYILIRNGNNLYRISTAINIYPRLFPNKSEINDIYAKVDNNNLDYFERKSKDDADDILLNYQRNIMILQGLIDRTDIFKPIPENINLFKFQDHSDNINMIYDGELLLPSHKKPFKEWQKEINSKIQRGSRIIFAGYNKRYYDGDKTCDRFFRYHAGSFSEPNLPAPDLYTVEDVFMDKPSYYRGETETLKILYFAGGEYWSWGKRDQERKNKTGFKLYKDDDFVLNYDLIDLDDVEFYLNSRIDRPNYLSMLPVLRKIKAIRLEELKWEQDFVRMVSEEFIRDGKNVSEKQVWDAVEWWKNKVIWKRPITKDDTKALRMIKSKLNKI